ncbi:MAG: orotate phosphoribosyltransferase [Oscillospiraceae bacterium]|jgi:orotate phosphoribosyltransferase|nr:orotate phosphoribosyltransferase [Oscillospiraceae bacterium]
MDSKSEFIKFLSDNGVLRFGDFTLKSGRKSPYFLNMGSICGGAALAELGRHYAECVKQNDIRFDVLFGPAYKGIPLVVTASAALSKSENYANITYCFDRKEEKDHGEGGGFVGKKLVGGDRVLLVDDVITSGKAIGEVLPKLRAAADVSIVGLVIAVDRMEKALDGGLSATEFVKSEYGINVYSCADLNDVVSALKNDVIPGKEYLSAMEEYKAKYGA